MDKMTSEDWAEKYNINLGWHNNGSIIDPDGWDRRNFEYSWGEEEITLDEFKERVFFSTVQMVKKGYYACIGDLKLYKLS